MGPLVTFFSFSILNFSLNLPFFFFQGKTCLLMSYVCQAFMEDYIPTMFDNFSAIEEIDGELINVIMWDTAGFI